MNLEQSVGFASLRVREPEIPNRIRTAEDIADFVFQAAEEKHQPFLYMMPEDWRRKWLKSRTFKLMNLPLSCAAAPCDAKDRDWVLTRIHAKAEHPIVVDMNKNGVGKSKNNGYVPPVIVLDGKHRFQAAALRGDSHILAWVGEEAVAEIQAQLDSKVKQKKAAVQISASTAFERQTRLHTQDLGGDRTAEEVDLILTIVDATGMKPKMVDKIVTKYRAMTAAMKKALTVYSAAPPGKENLVKELKKKPGVDNPWALAWHIHNEQNA